jgi:prepilin-type processing-associated H-X9-DG protein
VELLVSIAVITILIALLLPAVQQARHAARRVECTNNLRNITLAMVQVMDTQNRLPACGNYTAEFGRHHSWVVDVLPYLDYATLANQWNKDRSIYDLPNATLARQSIPVLTCPADISVVSGEPNLSYVVNGGVGFTVYHQGVHDCPVDLEGRRLDLDGDGMACPAIPVPTVEPSDKTLFLRLGVFFNETWKGEISRRHHRADTILDGLSTTVFLAENVRTGFNPADSGELFTSSWASPSGVLTSFYMGNPCRNATCTPGQVEYSLCNSGIARINSGIKRPEGMSPIPNSFHTGVVNMSFGDGHIRFVSENIDGGVYAALLSPQGLLLDQTELAQIILAGGEY